MEIALFIILIPFVLFLVLGLLGNKMKPALAGAIGTCGMAVSTGIAYFVAFKFFTSGSMAATTTMSFRWLTFTDKLNIDLGILLDPISVMMLVVITTISLMVHIYSLGYMKGERGFERYYAFLSLFSFAMLGLVVATGVFQMYIFWELVGASSYLLIGFYYTKPSAVAASKKAFIVTRFADLGFLIGILILSFYTGTFDFGALNGNHAELVISSTAGASFMGLSISSLAMALIFMGGAGKSAMFPMHIWLPDAMEGPTPVSALIHAATMVVAGVFLVARFFPVYYFAAPDVLRMIGYVGAFTALFAALIAITQTDIKRVLAFSTISQIAYMMASLGVSHFDGHDGLGYMASMFHLFTHAFFKALLFLGAGSVIHAVHSNEMKDMGGLRKYMPITNITFLIACLAIAGVPFLSGFFSKDEILAAAAHSNPLVYWTLILVAGLTAFYMFRLYFNIFWNKDNKEKYEHHKPHESPIFMTLPLIILAIYSIFTGYIPFSKYITADGQPFEMHLDWTVATTSVIVGLIGIALATYLYMRPSDKPAKLAKSFAGGYKLSLNKFYMDQVWMFVTKSVIFKAICMPIAWFDKHVIDGSIDRLGWVTNKTSWAIRKFQSGQVQFYVWVYLVGALSIAVISLFFL